MEQIEQLIEDYKRKLNIAQDILKTKSLSAYATQRVETKANCYRTFIAELEHSLKNCK